MDIKRVTSALLGFPLVLAIFLIGNKYVVDIALAIITLLAMDEYFNAVSKVAKPVKWVGYLSCLSISLLHVIPSSYLWVVVTLAIPTILLILFAQVIATEMKTSFKDIAYTFFGIAYIVFFTIFVALINGMKNGNILIWYVIFAAWGTDIFAYFTGKATAWRFLVLHLGQRNGHQFFGNLCLLCSQSAELAACIGSGSCPAGCRYSIGGL